MKERFKIDNKNAAIASRIIRDALEAGVIKEDAPKIDQENMQVTFLYGHKILCDGHVIIRAFYFATH